MTSQILAWTLLFLKLIGCISFSMLLVVWWVACTLKCCFCGELLYLYVDQIVEVIAWVEGGGNDVSMTNLLPPPTLSFSSSFGPSASKKLSLFSVSCARAGESRGERIENCVDDAYVAVCVWRVKGSIHGQSLLLSCTHSVERLQISLKSAIWSGTVQHHSPASLCL